MPSPTICASSFLAAILHHPDILCRRAGHWLCKDDLCKHSAPNVAVQVRWLHGRHPVGGWHPTQSVNKMVPFTGKLTLANCLWKQCCFLRAEHSVFPCRTGSVAGRLLWEGSTHLSSGAGFASRLVWGYRPAPLELLCISFYPQPCLLKWDHVKPSTN